MTSNCAPDERLAALAEDSVLTVQANEVLIATTRVTSRLDSLDGLARTLASTAEALDRGSQDLARSSARTAASAEQMRSDTHEAQAQVQAASGAMAEVRTTLDGLSAQMRELEAAASEVRGMLRAIEGIASQTNLLALNATIEASRAGAAGRGFAVVANEVKQLAQEASRVTHTIRGQVSKLESGVQGARDSTTAVNQVVQRGQKALHGAVTAADRTQEHIGELAGSAAADAQTVSQQTQLAGRLGGIAGQVAAVISDLSQQTPRIVAAVRDTESCLKNRLERHEADDLPTAILHRAKADHAIWKRKLANRFLDGETLTEAELKDHHACRLGRWYDHVADPVVTKDRAYVALAHPHAEVHRLGKEVDALITQGRLEEAERAFTAMEQASVDVARLLSELIARHEARSASVRKSA